MKLFLANCYIRAASARKQPRTASNIGISTLKEDRNITSVALGKAEIHSCQLSSAITKPTGRDVAKLARPKYP